MIKESLLYAKILLFGEYGIIEDSMGLSIPYNFYKGKLTFEKEKDDHFITRSNSDLRKCFDYLLTLSEAGNMLAKLDMQAFESDLDQGIHFNSNIPQGFGVGSSGALVAAVYNKYALNKITPADNSARKEIL